MDIAEEMLRRAREQDPTGEYRLVTDPDTRRAKVNSDFFSRACAGVAFYKESVAQCFECMRVCPVGRQERKLK